MAVAGVFIAAAAVLATILVEHANRKHERETHLDAVWQQVMSTVDDFPALSDISRTQNYLQEFDWQERLRYDAFCLQAWGACYQLVRQRRRPRVHQQLAIEWMAAYHHEWLRGNAQLFNDKRFWSRIDAIREREPLITIHRPVPTDAGGLADWTSLLERYFRTFLSPFDPSIEGRDRIDERIAEVIAAHSADAPVVVDLGCGTGNAFPSICAAGAQAIGLDRNQTALSIASRPDASGDARLVAGDMRRLPLRSASVDVAVCINSILPEDRADATAAFHEVHRVLRSDGVALFLLPAFETILHVRELRERAALQEGGKEHASRVRAAFDHLRQVDEATASYMDDGTTRQFFHSLTTISEDLERARLEVESGPERYRYPWPLTREFNYGYFPGEPETWDWLVVVRKAARHG